MDESFISDPNLIILLVGVFYIFWSLRQVVRKDNDFYNRDKYTVESAEKWSVVEGWLRVGSALVFCAYGAFGLYGIRILWPCLGALALLLAASLWLHDRILVKKTY